MKVLFDVTSLVPRNITGVGMYTKSLYRGLRGLGADVSPVYSPVKLKENFVEAHIQNSAKVFRSLFSPKKAIIHGTDGSLMSESPKFKKVITVHDMAMFRDDMMDPRQAKKIQSHLQSQLHSNPGAIIVPSHEVHAEFLVRFPKFMNKVHVVPWGSDHLIDSASVKSKVITGKPYFLYVGTLEKRKNLINIVKAFNEYCSLDKETQFVIIGSDGYGSEQIHKFIDSLPCKSRVIRTGYVPNAQLKKIYSGAVALVMPSLYEGFSLSVVEAMKMGCPVITSSLGALAELAGDSAHLVHPTKPEQITGGLERITFDRVYREKLISKGIERTEKMTWLNTARSTVDIYQKI